MASAQHSSIPAGASTTSVGQSSPAPVAVSVPNGDRIPLQIEGMDAAQVSNLLKNLPSLFHKVRDQVSLNIISDYLFMVDELRVSKFTLLLSHSLIFIECAADTIFFVT